MASTDILMSSKRISELAPGIFMIGAQGNSLAVETDKGVVLMDTGPGGEKTDEMIASLRGKSEKPIMAIVYSHGHLGYNFGAEQWLRHAAERGDPAPRVIAHARLPARYRRYQETSGLQAWINSHQFRIDFGDGSIPLPYHMPDETYETQLVLSGGNRDVVLLSAPSETDDVTALWVPDAGVLYGSAAVIRAMPNVGTPLRTMRDSIRWATTLEMMYALSPKIVVPEFGEPAQDPASIDDALMLPARVLRWIHAQVIERMNRGMALESIIHDMTYPEEWLIHKDLQQVYGTFDYIVRDVWRSENGWWDRNPTHLHPAAPKDVGAAVLSAISDPAHVLARAKALMEEHQFQLTLHVLDLLVDGPDDNPHVQEARKMKAQACESLSSLSGSFVSTQLYLSAADDMLGHVLGGEKISPPKA